MQKQELVLHWQKIEVENLFLRKIRDSIFFIVTKYMFNQNDIYDYPKKEDHYAIVIFEGTKQECEEAEQKVALIGITKINNMLDAIRQNRVFNILPRAIKAKFGKITYQPDVTPFEQLQMKLNFVGIGLYLVQDDV